MPLIQLEHSPQHFNSVRYSSLYCMKVLMIALFEVPNHFITNFQMTIQWVDRHKNRWPRECVHVQTKTTDLDKTNNESIMQSWFWSVNSFSSCKNVVLGWGWGILHMHYLSSYIYILHVTGGWSMALSAQNYMLGGIPCHNPHTWSSIPCIASWRGQAMASCSHYNEWQLQTWCPPCWCWGCILGPAHASSFRWVLWSCRMWWDQEVKFRASITFCSHSAHIEAKNKFKLKYDFFLWYTIKLFERNGKFQNQIYLGHKKLRHFYTVQKDSFKNSMHEDNF